jgi:hypothetical protein
MAHATCLSLEEFCVVQMLLFLVLSWLSINFGLPETENVPRIVFLPAEELQQRRDQRISEYQQDAIATHFHISEPDIHSKIVAFYDDQAKSIYLSDQWNGRTASELSVLVHEMVHHLQNVSGLHYACAAAREKLAYEAQEKWLGLFGRNLASEFAIDAMTLKLRTECIY